MSDKINPKNKRKNAWYCQDCGAKQFINRGQFNRRGRIFCHACGGTVLPGRIATIEKNIRTAAGTTAAGKVVPVSGHPVI